MSRVGEHYVVIQRRGRSHRARCDCGWTGHAWNELRPAEADAWHHVYGEDCIVDVSVIAGPDGALDQPTSRRSKAPGRARGASPALIARSPSLDRLVDRARALADSPSPYGKQAVSELRRFAADDMALVQTAIQEISDLLRRHSRRSAGTADSEWLQLITAKRLLQEILDQEDTGSYL